LYYSEKLGKIATFKSGHLIRQLTKKGHLICQGVSIEVN